MKNATLLLLGLFCATSILSQNSGTEILNYCGHNATIIDLIPWQNGILVSEVCNGSEIQSQTISKRDFDGAVEWEVDFFSYGSKFKMTPDSSFWIFETGGCDFLGPYYDVRNISKNGELLASFSGDFIEDGFTDIYMESNILTWINDSILAIPGYSSIAFFNTIQGHFQSEIEQSPGSIDINSMFPLGNGKYVAKTSSSLLFGEFEQDPFYYTADGEFHDIWVFNEQIYLYREDILEIINSNGELIGSYQIQAEFDLLDVSVQEQVQLLIYDNEVYQTLTLTLDLIEADSAVITQTDVFTPVCVLEINDKFLLGGWNGHHSTSQSVFKVYEQDGSSVFFDFDIELINVTIDSYNTSFQGEGPDYYVYAIYAENVQTEVRNNSAESIQGYTVYANLNAPGYCNGVVKVAQSNQTIAPSETVSFNFGNMFLAFKTVPFGDELKEIEFNYNKCLWIHAPSGKMDKQPENDYTCVNFSGSFTSVHELTRSSVKFIHQNEQDRIQLESNSTVDWEVYSVSGKRLMIGQNKQGLDYINLNQLSQGFYILKYISNGLEGAEKFVKR